MATFNSFLCVFQCLYPKTWQLTSVFFILGTIKALLYVYHPSAPKAAKNFSSSRQPSPRPPSHVSLHLFGLEGWNPVSTSSSHSRRLRLPAAWRPLPFRPPPPLGHPPNALQVPTFALFVTRTDFHSAMFWLLVGSTLALPRIVGPPGRYSRRLTLVPAWTAFSLALLPPCDVAMRKGV